MILESLSSLEFGKTNSHKKVDESVLMPYEAVSEEYSSSLYLWKEPNNYQSHQPFYLMPAAYLAEQVPPSEEAKYLVSDVFLSPTTSITTPLSDTPSSDISCLKVNLIVAALGRLVNHHGFAGPQRIYGNHFGISRRQRADVWMTRTFRRLPSKCGPQ